MIEACIIFSKILFLQEIDKILDGGKFCAKINDDNDKNNKRAFTTFGLFNSNRDFYNISHSDN